ncbi:MAG: peptide-methionine (S)-S-oxide reductase MsrA [Pseudomonadota bacterium]
MTRNSLLVVSFAVVALGFAAASVFAFSNATWAPPAVAGSKNAAAVAEREQYDNRISTGALEVATFGGGCFWCVETNFDGVKGVVATISGYMGGALETADYQTVSTGRTKHIEVLQVIYDPKQTTFDKILGVFLRTTDVVDGGGQFCDRGPQYRPAVFAHGQAQLDAARKETAALDASQRFDKPLAVEILKASLFVPAEDYHQDYYKKNPLRYKSYRYGCGRDLRVKRLWGDEALTH